MNYRDRLNPRVLSVIGQIESNWSEDDRLISTPDTDLNIICDLIDQYKINSILELGTRIGHTALVLASVTKRAMTVDINTGAIETARKYSELAGLNLECVVGDSKDVGIISRAVGFSAVFLDTSHVYEDTLSEISAYAPRVKYLILHDCSSEEDRKGTGVRRAFIDWLADNPNFKGDTYERPDYPSDRGVGVIYGA